MLPSPKTIALGLSHMNRTTGVRQWDINKRMYYTLPLDTYSDSLTLSGTVASIHQQTI